MKNLYSFPTPIGYAEFDGDGLAEFLHEKVTAEHARSPEADFDSFLKGFVRGVIAAARIAEGQ